MRLIHSASHRNGEYPRATPLAPDRFPFPVVIVHNDSPKGYGANHNAAFKLMQGNAFSVLSTDIRLTADPFVVLTERLDALKAGIVAPLILGPEGQIEDTIRRMITPLRIVKKGFGVQKSLAYEIGPAPIAPD